MRLKIPLLSRGLKLANSEPALQLFISLWNRYHQWLSVIELIQTSASFSFLLRINPGFTSESKFGFEIASQLADTRKRPSSYLKAMLRISTIVPSSITSPAEFQFVIHYQFIRNITVGSFILRPPILINFIFLHRGHIWWKRSLTWHWVLNYF